MKKNFLLILVFCLFASCGVKDNPEYKSQINNKIIYFI